MAEKLENAAVHVKPVHEPRKTIFDFRLDFKNDRHHGAYLTDEMPAEAVADSLQVMVDNIRSDIKHGLL